MQTVYTDKNNLHIAAEIIRNGGTVVFPTETVYGLGGNAFDQQAIDKIYAAKQRPTDNPLIIHIGALTEIEQLTSDFTASAKRIADHFMPGPITVILKRKASVPSVVSAGLDTVAVRCPANEIARELIRLSGVPVAAPSANISGNVSGTGFQNVKNELHGLVDCMIDGGDCDYGIESTVIDVTGRTPVLLRPGSITLEMINEVLPDTVLHPSLLTGKLSGTPASPGMKYKHYAPKAKVVLVKGDYRNIADFFSKTLKSDACILMFDEYLSAFPERAFRLGSYNNLNEMAHLLFSQMKKADNQGFSTMYIPAVSEKGIGFSIMNRLKKAAGGEMINI